MLKFHQQDKLIYLGSLVIRNVHSHKAYVKRTDKGMTSPLYETCNMSLSLCEVVNISSDNLDYFDRLNSTIEMKDFDIMLTDLYKRDWFMHDVFIISQSKPISRLSKETTINRKYLTDSRKQAQIYLKNQLENYI